MIRICIPRSACLRPTGNTAASWNSVRSLQSRAGDSPPSVSPIDSFADLTPDKIVKELDRHIIAQDKAKRCVAIALRERWRRQKLRPELQNEVFPSNILMIGPTGSGKTETARRLSHIVGAPFAKVEATRYTEVGIYGTDTEEMIRDLVEAAIHMHRSRLGKQIEQEVKEFVDETILNALYDSKVPDTESVRGSIITKYHAGDLEQDPVAIDIRGQDTQHESNPIESVVKTMKKLVSSRAPQSGKPVAMMFEVSDERQQQAPGTKQCVPVAQARRLLMESETASRIDSASLIKTAIADAEQNGIIFVDEIDKVAQSTEEDNRRSAKGEGVQKELLPIIEGTTIRTPYGTVRTDHILFIASGAFSKSKPSDLLPELQGRLPIRVQLDALSKTDFRRILSETEFNLLQQQIALLATEGVALSFSDDGIDEIASVCWEMNRNVENIGARRLRTVLAKVLEDISFKAPNGDTCYCINRDSVKQVMKSEFNRNDLSRFVL